MEFLNIYISYLLDIWYSFNSVVYIGLTGKTYFPEGINRAVTGAFACCAFFLLQCAAVSSFLIISPFSPSFPPSLYPSIPLPSSSVCHVSRSSLRRPLKKIWMSWFSPCWSTAAQRRWTRGSVLVLDLFFTLSYLNLSFYHSLLCSGFGYLCHTRMDVCRHICLHTHTRHVIHSELNRSHITASSLSPRHPLTFDSSFLSRFSPSLLLFLSAHAVPLSPCLSLLSVFLSVAALMKV